ncbi:hypothetical protein [Burkholderia stagnalis]|uniref:hypothetical protein n=1 Tax=Burkholderia stagnalis TaxID=1503054 RepID=UPI000B26993E|nr:hypothetical protein [Burkholderia stagnalis]
MTRFAAAPRWRQNAATGEGFRVIAFSRFARYIFKILAQPTGIDPIRRRLAIQLQYVPAGVRQQQARFLRHDHPGIANMPDRVFATRPRPIRSAAQHSGSPRAHIDARPILVFENRFSRGFRPRSGKTQRIASAVAGNPKVQAISRDLPHIEEASR